MSLAQQELTDSSKDSTPIAINDLPNEILTRIFTVASRYRLEDSSLLHSQIDVPFLLLVSHVCRHWRDVAVEASFLWSYVDFKFPSLVELFLSRSQSAPLTIVSRYPKDHPRLRVIFTRHLSRIQHIWMSHGIPTFIVDFMVHVPVPSLESVFIIASSEAALPVNFFGCHCPRLSKVKLLRVNLPLAPPPFPTNSLTYLFMTGVPIPRLIDLLEMLQTQPNILTLQIHISLPPPQYMSFPKVELPKLQELRLSDHPLSLQRLLECITYPRDAVLDLSVVSNYQQWHSLAGFFVAQAGSMRSLSISDEEDVFEASVQATSQDVAGRTHRLWRRGYFDSMIRLRRDSDFGRQSLAPYLTAFCQRLDLRSVTTLCCMTPHDDNDQWWSSIFGMMTSLRNLTLPPKLLTALRDCLLGGGDADIHIQQSTSPRLPFLEVISVFESWRNLLPRNYDLLLLVLKSREDLGVPVKKLYIETYISEFPACQEISGRFSSTLQDIEVIGRDSEGRVWFPRQDVVVGEAYPPSGFLDVLGALRR